ncbi:hypothetical protein B0H19DRAFT_1024982 [Mycena capillaripes]|nr:hypothetical protein B0H19DRAFT_1024982 [Mycena capillaripes]
MLVAELVEVQHTSLRRLLGLNSQSLLAVLSTETGLMPVRIRRLLFALGRLHCMLYTDSTRGIDAALLDSVALLRQGKLGWATDLTIMLRCLPTPIDVGSDDLLSTYRIESIKKEIVCIADPDLQRDIDNLVKTHLLRNRVEMGDHKTKKLSLVTRRLRHYLTMVVGPAHHKAITGRLLGDHNLSVERLQYPARSRDAVPRENRLCQFCRGGIEDEVHALLDCTGNPRIFKLRSQFLNSLEVRIRSDMAVLLEGVKS